MNVLVTGASGRLGVHVCSTLKRRGHSVRATDHRRVTPEDVETQLVDLLDADSIRRSTAGSHAVVHLGNHSSLKSGPPPEQLLAENAAMNENVFRAALASGVERIVFASSIQVMIPMPAGTSPEPPYPLPYLPLDSAAPANPGSNQYAQSKQLGEQLLAELAAEHPALGGTSLRFPMLVDRLWVSCLRRTSTLSARAVNFGEALSYLPFSDAADLVARVVERPAASYRQYFPARALAPRGIALSDLIRARYSNVPLTRPVAEISSLVDVDGITREVGWQPEPALSVELEAAAAAPL